MSAKDVRHRTVNIIAGAVLLLCFVSTLAIVEYLR